MSADAGFTRFVLDLYGAPGVSSACLLLQERRALDVNLVLFAAYVGVHRGRALTAMDLDDVAASVRPWQDEVVRPLRQVRRRLVDGPEPAPNGATDTLRDRIKGIELEAEMIELEQLSLRAAPLTDDDRTSATAHLRAVLAIETMVGDDARSIESDQRRAIDVIAAAAARLGSGA